MKARDVMVSPVVTVMDSTTVQDVARVLLRNRVSAVPVVDEAGKLVGIVSEGDLLHRAEAGTERRHSWWLRLVSGDDALASDYVKANSRRVADVMTPNPIVVSPDAPLGEVATLLEKHSIKRVPVVSDGRIVGIVSRANLVQALASGRREIEMQATDEELRRKIMARLEAQPWAHTSRLNVTVADGVVDLWGATASDAERQAVRVVAENTAGVRAVNDNMIRLPAEAWL